MNHPQTPESRQPRGLWTLFGTECFERWSFYGMKAQLVIFLITAVTAGGMGWSKEDAGTLMAWYAGLVYLTPVAGGLIADRWLGTHRCLVIGGVIIALGHFVLLFEGAPAMFTGLALVVIGTGFFKSNVSTMVGQLYRPNDPRRTPGFSIYYMGINLGAFVAPLVCGWLQVFAGARFGASLGWRLGFMAAGIGMVAGLTQYLLAHRSHLAGIGDPPSAHKETDRSHEPLTPTERTRIGAIVVFSFVVIFFFAAFEQSSTSMAFFAAEHTDRAVPRSLAWLVGGSDTFPAAWFQSVNPLLILALAPLFARLWPALRRRSSEPSAPGKMGVGLILLGLGFVFMIAAGALSDRAHLAPPWLLVAMLFIHTLSELCISPVGLALVTELAPRKYAAMLMGVWFIGAFVGNFIAGKAAGQVDWFSAHTGPLGGLQGYYTIFTAGPILAGLGLLMASKRVNRWMAIEP